jgi:hypothetical protein
VQFRLQLPGARIKLDRFEGRDRVGLIAAIAVLLSGMALLGLPIHAIRAGAGWIHGGDGTDLIPTLCFYAGQACLFGALVATIRATRGSNAERVSTIALALVGIAAFGATLRQVLQLAALHDFYVARISGEGATSASVRYWGITILLISAIGFALPAGVALANTVPSDPSRF